jgi:hypothetical protein
VGSAISSIAGGAHLTQHRHLARRAHHQHVTRTQLNILAQIALLQQRAQIDAAGGLADAQQQGGAMIGAGGEPPTQTPDGIQHGHTLAQRHGNFAGLAHLAQHRDPGSQAGNEDHVTVAHGLQGRHRSILAQSTEVQHARRARGVGNAHRA